MRNSRHPNEIELAMKLEIENEWEVSDEIQEVNSTGRIEQLNSLRLAMKSGKYNFRGRAGRKFGK